MEAREPHGDEHVRHNERKMQNMKQDEFSEWHIKFREDRLPEGRRDRTHVMYHPLD